MNTKTPRQASEKDDKVPVTAIGNSWIVCKSKSYAGRVYYFNTLTGEAAWNLSDTEMEKAKKRTNILKKQPEAIYEGCPEPKDPPNDNVHMLKRNDSQQSCSLHPQPQQLLNNQFSSEQSQEPSMNTVLFNCPVNAMNTHSTPIFFNPNVWAIPPNHQLVLAPTHQTPTSLSVAYNNLEQHLSVQDISAPRGFNTFKRSRGKKNLRCNRGFNKRTLRRNYMNVGQRQTDLYQFNNFNGPSTSNDLRQLLSAKRQREMKSFESKDEKANDTNTDNKQKIRIIKLTSEELHASDADDQWLRAHGYIEGTQLKLNVKPIKDIVILDESMDCWYIVADASTLMGHFNFISIVVGSDEKCQLMISDDTMAELQAISRSDDIILMRRACLVLRLLDTGHAVLGKDYSDDTGEKNIIAFTIKLAEQNHNVVLVSNNIETTESNYGINIFTIEQMKEIITNTPIEEKSQPQDFQDTGRIKIVVPNDTMSFDSLTVEKTEKSSVYEENRKDNKEKDSENHISMSIGVQTENEIEHTAYTTFPVPFHSDSLSVKSKSKDNLSKIQCDQANTDNTIENEGNNANHPPKRRGIRLKRNTSINQSTVSNENNTGRKQFKWRRRKKEDVDVETTTESKQPTSVNIDSCNDNANQYPDLSDNVVAENFYSNKFDENNKITHKDPQADNCSETTSGSCFIVKENSKIVIEETSTSGIISNSPSIVESENFNSAKQNFSNYILNNTCDQESNKCVMYEVENSVMEEHLKIRSDEWLSRFVQIMEDILTQVLRLDPPFIHSSLPPPWTLHEATECIKRKFHTECDITDSASKLAEFLYHNSDNRGKLNSPLEPGAFMEMYSYGVYLVDSLQAVITNCNDLQTAVDSLAKLMAEIENPTEYDTNNDSFNEELDDPTPSASLCVSDYTTEKESNSTYKHKKEDVEQLERRSDNNDQNSNRKYNLRSSQRSSYEKIPEPEPVSFIRNIDVESTFFSSLALKKNLFTSPKKNTEKDKKTINLIISPQKNSDKDKKGNNDNNSTEQDTTGPKIIRNFSKHTEFEERLKNKERTDYFNSMCYNDEGLDYEEDEDDYAEGEYDVGEEEFPDEELEEGEIGEYDYYSEDIGDVSGIKSKTEKGEKVNSEKDENCNFNLVAGKIVYELRQAFIQVHTFCANVCNELKSSVPLNPARRILIREEAETAKMDLDKLIKSLNSIIVREDKECGSSIQSVLQKAGLVFDYGQAVEYRNSIAKCTQQACVLLESVNIVLEAVK